MIKIDLITGFLGSGKTTFIKEYASYLIERGENIAIIVNDHGAINVDRLLLGDALGDRCHLEMVIGGDVDCTRRRLKTKLISMAMCGYTYVIVEPSGIFDVDDFLDMLYEEPLERWYEMGNIISLLDADMVMEQMSDEARYIMISEVAKAGVVVLSKLEQCAGVESKNQETTTKTTIKTTAKTTIETTVETRIKTTIKTKDKEQDIKDQILTYINESLELFKCSHKINDMYVWKRGQISDEEFKRISRSGYYSGEMIKLPLSNESLFEKHFDSLFFFHVKTDISNLEETINKIFCDKAAGNVMRLKGFIQNEGGNWLEVNATKNRVNIESISTGQELFIVIGEGLDEKVIGGYWDEYRNGL